jgi:hypothetical protein
LPLVLTGNDLLGGHVVYFDGAGWSRHSADACVAADEAGAALLDAVRAASAGRIVDPYLVTVALGPDGAVMASHYRERIRAGGRPTFAREGIH